MIRAMIVDDELHAREEMVSLLQEFEDIEVIATCSNAVEAIKALNRDRPDVLFLDIQMPMIDGFELLSMIDQEVMPHIVFVTAYDAYALKAFEEKTLDYLLKPVEPTRLVRAVEKVRGALKSGEHPTYDAPPLAHIPCVTANKIKLVPPSEVEHIRSDLSGIHIVTPRSEFFTELTLKVLEGRTPLVRCHKQYLVNLTHIDEIVLLEHGLAEIKTRAGHRIPVSRRYLKSLKETLGI